MFWATRGKRSDMDVEDMEDFWATRGKKQTIKPNGFFQVVREGFKKKYLWKIP